MSKREAIFVRNRRRAIRDALGRDVQFVPEHERLNMTPIMADNVSEDFMNEKRRRGPLGSRKPPAAPVVGSGRSRAVAPNQEEQAWLPRQDARLPGGDSRPYQIPEKDYSHGNVPYDDVPSPPQNKFEHQHRALGVDLSTVLPGQYCLVYENEVWASDSADEIEAAVEQIMRNDPNVQDDDLIVLHRLHIKVGVSIGG